MKIECLTTFLDDGNRYQQGETRVVDDALGEYFCRAGWAKDLSGGVPTATPDKTDVVLKIDNANHVTEAENVNG